MALVWENEGAMAPDGTRYVLSSESIRHEGTWWKVIVYEPGAVMPSRTLGVESGMGTKRRVRALAEADARARAT